MKIRVYYEDTDCAGIVYHANYIKFCERARSELFFQKGIFFEDDGFILRSQKADYLKSASLGDMLEIKTDVLEHNRATLTIYQEIRKENDLIFTLESKLVYMKKWKVSRMDAFLLALIDEIKE